MRDLPRVESSPPASATIWLGWGASILLLALLIWGGYAYRNDVMRVWPPSQRLYAALGLGPPPAQPPAATKGPLKTP